MSQVYSLWVNKMLKSREEARSLRELLSFTKKKEADPLMDYLVSFRDRMGKARELLTDAELDRLLLRHPAGGAADRRHHPLHRLVPRLRHPGRRRDRQHADRQERGQRQVAGVRPQPRGHAGPLHGRRLEKFDGMVRSIVPLYETEVRGMEMLNRMADSMFTSETRIATP